MRKLYLPGAGLLGAVVLATLAWLLMGAPARTEAQGACASADPVASYDLTYTVSGGKISDTQELPEEKVEWRIDGKVVYEHWSTETTTGEPVSTELIFDGDSTIYERFPPYEQYSMRKTDRSDNEDVGSHDFPFGRATLCPDAKALNAEYVETDETGKKYQVKGEKDFTVYWTDEDGWLVRAEGAFSTSETAVAVLVVSGIGEDNAIPTPQPPYRKDPSD